jgi:hypothetical protein
MPRWKTIVIIVFQAGRNRAEITIGAVPVYDFFSSAMVNMNIYFFMFMLPEIQI